MARRFAQRRYSTGGASGMMRATISAVSTWSAQILTALVIVCRVLDASSLPSQAADYVAAKAANSCSKNQDYTLNQYLEIAADATNWTREMFKRVPNDLSLELMKREYVVMSMARDRLLPLDNAPLLGGLRPSYRFVSPCRVRDIEGRWWLVYPDDWGFLSYVREETIEVAKPHLKSMKQGERGD